jgi:hypothetical protein
MRCCAASLRSRLRSDAARAGLARAVEAVLKAACVPPFLRPRGRRKARTSASAARTARAPRQRGPSQVPTSTQGTNQCLSCMRSRVATRARTRRRPGQIHFDARHKPVRQPHVVARSHTSANPAPSRSDPLRRKAQTSASAACGRARPHEPEPGLRHSQPHFDATHKPAPPPARAHPRPFAREVSALSHAKSAPSRSDPLRASASTSFHR